MHKTSIKHAKLFIDSYLIKKSKILDIGSQSVNSVTFKEILNNKHEYVGIDMIKGKNVDIVQDDPYKIPFNNDTFDVAVSTSTFEHTEFFWLTFNEIIRVLKPNGLFYLNAPSNGRYHRYPVDCYRFYPDSGNALQKWAEHSGYKKIVMLESFVGKRDGGLWNDFCSIFLKDKDFVKDYPRRIVSEIKDFNYGISHEENLIINNFPSDDDNVLNLLKKFFFFYLKNKFF
jgi:SAM-dependent methyltransferase